MRNVLILLLLSATPVLAEKPKPAPQKDAMTSDEARALDYALIKIRQITEEERQRAEARAKTHIEKVRELAKKYKLTFSTEGALEQQVDIDTGVITRPSEKK